mmetsp:Transcript_59681/g.176843  ORF Transcript_59681/g.176843 Transcript_59681/m.176843 type:complete len:243 (-) Transcript_59681:38-766(-)
MDNITTSKRARKRGTRRGNPNNAKFRHRRLHVAGQQVTMYLKHQNHTTEGKLSSTTGNSVNSRVFHGRWPESLRLLGADLLVHVLLAQPRRQSTELSHEPSQFVDSLDQFLLRLRHVHDVVYRSVEFLLGHDFLLLKFGRPGLVLLELLGGFRQPRLLVGGRGGANTGEGGRRESRRGRPEEGSSIASRGCGGEGHIPRRSEGGVRCDERRGGSGESEKDGGDIHGFPSLLFGSSVAILCKR